MKAASPRGIVAIIALACFLCASLPAPAAVATGSPEARRLQADPRMTGPGDQPGTGPAPVTSSRTYRLFDGSTAVLGDDGFGIRRDAHGGARPVTMVRPQGGSILGGSWGPDERAIIRRLSLPQRGAYVPGELIVVFDRDARAAGLSTSGSGDARAVEFSKSGFGARQRETPAEETSPTALTGDAAIDEALQRVGAVSLRAVAPDVVRALSTMGAPSASGSGIPGTLIGRAVSGAASAGESETLIGSAVPAAAPPASSGVPLRSLADLANAYVVRVKGLDARAAAARLRDTPGIRYAGPNWTVGSMASEPRPMPRWVVERAAAAASGRAAAVSGRTAMTAPRHEPSATLGGSTLASSTLPSNYGLSASLQSHINAGGVDAAGAFDILARRAGALPGDGTIITNVSIGDLTDQAMADAGDQYVQFFGPTTVVQGGQRYLDFPSMPLIPAWGASLDGTLDPLAAVEFTDPYLGEVLLDFSVMAPLPHDRQRPGAEGQGTTDLLGIAPGAQYRLVVPEEPTLANILAALVAAAGQQPRPDVITVSLGFGFDVNGFPGRYLEEDPIVRAAVRSIVHDLGIVVAISAGDGLRLFTPASVGPDGGSAPTLLAAPGSPTTTVDQVARSTAPARIDDSGAIDVGGSTLDDLFSAPPQAGGALASAGSFPETRLNGSTGYASGFGSRVNVSAPSDNIPALLHVCTGYPCTAQMAVTALDSGTSASTPMVAAAAAVVLQSARLAGRSLTPLEVRGLLAGTGRTLPNPPQSPTDIAVGKQIDLTAAVESLLGPGASSPTIVRMAVAHRQAVADLGATFVEATDTGAIDLEGPPQDFGPPLGQNVVGPITFAPDIVGEGGGGTNRSYALRIGQKTFSSSSPVIRLLPQQILAAAGLPVVSTTPRTVPITYEVRNGGSAVASASLALTFGPSDGTYSEALMPGGPPVVAAGKPYKVSYDLTHVRGVNRPRLIVSSVGHWSPAAAPFFRNERIIPISANDTQITIPADAFTGGAGMYGIGILQDSVGGAYGWFGTVRVKGSTSDVRPDAPVLTVPGGVPAFDAALTRASSQLTVGWNASAVPGATGAALEISAPGPTLFNSISTFTNQNGDRRDADGVDAGSVLWYPLPSVSGSVTLDAAALGLPSSLFYSGRIFATGSRGPVGSASAVSGIGFDDGVTPGAELVNDFDIVPSGGSLVATSGFDLFGNLTDGALRPYAPATGTYGAPFAQDPTGQSAYYMFGSDPTLHRTATIRYDWYGTLQDLESYDSLTGSRLASVPVDSASEFALIGGRVDSGRHRAALLGWSGTDYSDNVLPFDLASGALGQAIFADEGTDEFGIFTTLDVDARSGNALVTNMLWGDLCLFFDGALTSVDLDRGEAAKVVPAANCVTGLAADQQDRTAYLTVGPIFGFPRLFPVARYQTVDQGSLRTSGLADLGARSPLFPVVDPLNGLLLVGFAATDTYLEDNNAMSAIGVFNARSGKQIALLPQFNFIAQVFGPNGLVGNERGIQVDPATRTGWTYGPGGVQVQQFKY